MGLIGTEMTSETVPPIGFAPPIDPIPTQMWAQAIAQSDLGAPVDAFKRRLVDVPKPGPNEVLVAVMAAGINFNNVWAAQGVPVDVIATRQKRGRSSSLATAGRSRLDTTGATLGDYAERGVAAVRAAGAGTRRFSVCSVVFSQAVDHSCT